MGNGKKLASDLARRRKVALDSSILIYHLEDLAPYAELTQVAFALLAQGTFSAVISTISVTELLAKPFAERKEQSILMCERFLQGLPHTAMVAPSYSIAREAARLRGRYALRTPDALLLGTALHEGAKALLTNDEQFKQIRGEGIAIILLNDYAP